MRLPMTQRYVDFHTRWTLACGQRSEGLWAAGVTALVHSCAEPYHKRVVLGGRVKKWGRHAHYRDVPLDKFCTKEMRNRY